MQKSLKTCSQCGAPIRVERSVTGGDVVCGRCRPDPSDPSDLQEFDDKPLAKTDANLMLSIGLMLFAPGLVLITVGALVGSFSYSHLKIIRYSAAIVVFGRLSSIVGFFAVSVSGVVCMFVPPKSRAARPLIVANGILLVLILTRVVNSNVVSRYTSLQYASVALAVIWLFSWVFFLLRTSDLVDQRFLAIRVAVVLPVVAVCFNIGLLLHRDVQSSSPMMQLMRVAVFSACLFAAVMIFRIGYVFRSNRANQIRAISKQDRLQTS